MTVMSLEDLLLRELKRTRATETLVESSVLRWGAGAIQNAFSKDVESFLNQTRQRIQSLDKAFQLIGQPVGNAAASAETSIVGDVEQLVAGIDNEASREAAKAAGLALLRHHVLARYGVLTSWAEALQRSDLAKLLKATLDKESDLLAQQAVASNRSSKDAGMGARLTALFDDKK